MLEKVLKEHNYQESALLEILHRAQEIYGYLDKDLLMDISGSLNLPPSHVYGVATFYSFFKLRKPGEHVVTGCLGTACYVKGVEQIMQAVEEEFNLKRGGSTTDGKLSLLSHPLHRRMCHGTQQLWLMTKLSVKPQKKL